MTPHLLPSCPLWKQVTMYSLQLSGELYSVFLRVEDLCKLEGQNEEKKERGREGKGGKEDLQGRFVCPPYLFMELCVSILTHGYLFYTLDYNPILHRISCSNCSSFGPWEPVPPWHGPVNEGYRCLCLSAPSFPALSDVWAHLGFFLPQTWNRHFLQGAPGPFKALSSAAMHWRGTQLWAQTV